MENIREKGNKTNQKRGVHFPRSFLSFGCLLPLIALDASLASLNVDPLITPHIYAYTSCFKTQPIQNQVHTHVSTL